VAADGGDNGVVTAATGGDRRLALITAAAQIAESPRGDHDAGTAGIAGCTDRLGKEAVGVAGPSGGDKKNF
jgi:hypothetical protein